MYDQHTRGMATTRHKSQGERGGRKALVRDKDLAHKQKGNTNVRKPICTNLKKKDLST